MICTFIGHKDTPREVELILKSKIIELIEKNNVDKFYVGTHGNFDFWVLKVLRELKESYKFDYSVVLPYFPKSNDKFAELENTIIPDGLEKVPPRFGIIKRNRWMIEQSDYLVCYVKQDITNAYDNMKYAEKMNKEIINLAN